MSEQYDNELKGVLFKNNEKLRDEDRDYAGQCTINGKELWISGWKGVSKSGTPYLRLSFKAKEAPAPANKPKAKPAFDDSIGF
jgi:hypothetical protein